MRSLMLLFAVGLVCTLLQGCGNDSDLIGDYRVINVDIIASDIQIGEQVRTTVFFETKTGLDGSPDEIQVVARLVPSLRYVLGSAEIFDDNLDDSDRIDADVVACPDGSSFVSIRLSGADLSGRPISGNDGFALKFEVAGVSSDSAARVEAAADENQSFACSSTFNFEEIENVEVL